MNVAKWRAAAAYLSGCHVTIPQNRCTTEAIATKAEKGDHDRSSFSLPPRKVAFMLFQVYFRIHPTTAA
jgi:hypothetical protein